VLPLQHLHASGRPAKSSRSVQPPCGDNEKLPLPAITRLMLQSPRVAENRLDNTQASPFLRIRSSSRRSYPSPLRRVFPEQPMSSSLPLLPSTHSCFLPTIRGSSLSHSFRFLILGFWFFLQMVVWVWWFFVGLNLRFFVG
jgi:hypothetical protein